MFWLFGVGFYYRQKSKKAAVTNFASDFYTSGRGMGGLVVGMMIGASVCSSGTFIGGPATGTVQSSLSYKNSKAMHGAIIVGVIFVTFWQGIMTFMGPAARLMNLVPAVADHTTPVIAMTVLPPWMAGIIIAGAVGAIQSTIASMLLIITSSAINDIYRNYVKKDTDNEQLKKVTYGTTTIILIVIFAFSLKPPDFLQMLINFALGGLETVFFGPMILGLFWKRANEQGALSGMVTGLICYYLFSYPLKPMIIGMQPVLPASLIALTVMVVVSLITPKPPKGVIMTWFGKTYPKRGG